MTLIPPRNQYFKIAKRLNTVKVAATVHLVWANDLSHEAEL